MSSKQELPLRTGVGVVLLNSENKVFVGKRIDNPKDFWQMPQGGIDQNENFLQAAKNRRSNCRKKISNKIICLFDIISFYDLCFYLDR